MNGIALRLETWIRFLATSLSIVSSVLLVAGCHEDHDLGQPDTERFNQFVASPALRDSLANSRLTPGMPYFVASGVLSGLPGLHRVAVPSLGSKQELEEVEGRRRYYVDPDIRVYMDTYKTKDGELAIWYQKPDFYRMGVAAGDTLAIFLADTVAHAEIQCVRSHTRMQIGAIKHKLPQRQDVYAEVHHRDHPWRTTTYWYALQVRSDAQTISLRSTSFDLYPIEVIELDGVPVSSYPWR